MDTNQIVVLVVEDEFILRDQVVDQLEDAGFRVLAVGNAGAAVETLENKGGDIRALVTDVNLGGGGSGWEVAHKARELNSLLPVIYTTSYGADVWAAHGVPNSIHIVKPFLPIQLLTGLAQLLNSSPPSPELPSK